MSEEIAKQKADTLIEVMNIINTSFSLSEAKKAINKLAIAAIKDYHKARK